VKHMSVSLVSCEEKEYVGNVMNRLLTEYENLMMDQRFRYLNGLLDVEKLSHLYVVAWI